MKPAHVRVLALVLCLALEDRITGSDPSDDARATLARGFKQYEGLIETLYVEYDKMIERTALERALPNEPADSNAPPGFVFRARPVAAMSEAARLWRKGVKQRSEVFRPPSAAAPLWTATFDGYICRDLLNEPANGLTARIATAERRSWAGSPKNDPIAFMFRYYETPLSEIIEKSVDFANHDLPGDSGSMQELSFQGGGRFHGHFMKILIDQGRSIPLEREVLIAWEANSEPSPNHKLLFQDYKAYPATTDRQAIWFPSHIVYLGYAGRLPNGELLVVRRENYVIRTVRPNVEMPDSLFELTFPDGVQVVEESPWIERAVAGTMLERIVLDAKWLCNQWWMVPALAFVLVTASYLFFRWKRPRESG